MRSPPAPEGVRSPSRLPSFFPGRRHACGTAARRVPLTCPAGRPAACHYGQLPLRYARRPLPPFLPRRLSLLGLPFSVSRSRPWPPPWRRAVELLAHCEEQEALCLVYPVSVLGAGSPGHAFLAHSLGGPLGLPLFLLLLPVPPLSALRHGLLPAITGSSRSAMHFSPGPALSPFASSPLRLTWLGPGFCRAQEHPSGPWHPQAHWLRSGRSICPPPVSCCGPVPPLPTARGPPHTIALASVWSTHRGACS
jgi:hypothetical protein